jgi:hypothetical protein
MQTTNSASSRNCNHHPRLHPHSFPSPLTNSPFPFDNPFIYSIPGIYPPGGGHVPSQLDLNPNLPPPALSGAAHD